MIGCAATVAYGAIRMVTTLRCRRLITLETRRHTKSDGESTKFSLYSYEIEKPDTKWQRRLIINIALNVNIFFHEQHWRPFKLPLTRLRVKPRVYGHPAQTTNTFELKKFDDYKNRLLRY